VNSVTGPVLPMASKKLTTPAVVTFYGTGQDAAVRAENVTLDAAGRASFTLHTPTEQGAAASRRGSARRAGGVDDRGAGHGRAHITSMR